MVLSFIVERWKKFFSNCFSGVNINCKQLTICSLPCISSSNQSNWDEKALITCTMNFILSLMFLIILYLFSETAKRCTWFIWSWMFYFQWWASDERNVVHNHCDKIHFINLFMSDYVAERVWESVWENTMAKSSGKSQTLEAKKTEIDWIQFVNMNAPKWSEKTKFLWLTTHTWN